MIEIGIRDADHLFSWRLLLPTLYRVLRKFKDITFLLITSKVMTIQSLNFTYFQELLNMVTGHFGPKPSRPLDTSAPSHLGPKPSRPHLKINSWTLRPLVISAPSHLGPTALVTSAPVWKLKYFLYFCTIFAYYNSFSVLKVQSSPMKFRAQ